MTAAAPQAATINTLTYAWLDVQIANSDEAMKE